MNNLVDTIFDILFDKTDFFNFKKSFYYHFPSTTFPKIRLIGSKPIVDDFQYFLQFRISRAKSILRKYSYYLVYLPSPVVKVIIKYLNNYFVYLCKHNITRESLKKQQILQEQIIKKDLKKKNYVKKFKQTLSDKFVSSIEEDEAVSQPVSNDSSCSISPDKDIILKSIPLDEPKPLGQIHRLNPMSHLVLVKYIREISFSIDYDTSIGRKIRFFLNLCNNGSNHSDYSENKIFLMKKILSSIRLLSPLFFNLFFHRSFPQFVDSELDLKDVNYFVKVADEFDIVDDFQKVVAFRDTVENLLKNFEFNYSAEIYIKTFFYFKIISYHSDDLFSSKLFFY